MKYPITTMYILLIFLSIIVFSFLAISFVEHTGEHSCPVPLAGGNYCISASSSATIALHHISKLQNLTQFITSSNIFYLILSLIFTFVYLFFSKLQKIKLPISASSFQGYYGIEELNFKSKKDMLGWLALRNKIDPHIFRLVHDIT